MALGEGCLKMFCALMGQMSNYDNVRACS